MYVVISGGGKVGEYLATVLLSSGNDVAVIESDRQTADRLSAEASAESTSPISVKASGTNTT